MKCPPRGDVREFLDELQTKREELDQVGVAINNNDYRSTIIASVLSTLASFASATLTATFLLDLCVLPTENFQVEESIPLAWFVCRSSCADW